MFDRNISERRTKTGYIESKLYFFACFQIAMHNVGRDGKGGKGVAMETMICNNEKAKMREWRKINAK